MKTSDFIFKGLKIKFWYIYSDEKK